MMSGFELLPKNDYDRLKKKAEESAAKRAAKPQALGSGGRNRVEGQAVSIPTAAVEGQTRAARRETLAQQAAQDKSRAAVEPTQQGPSLTPQGALEQRKAGGQGNVAGENNAGIGAASGQLGQTTPAGGPNALVAATARDDLGGTDYVRGVQPGAAAGISSLTPTTRTPGTDVAGPATPTLGATTAGGQPITVPTDARNVVGNEATFQERLAAFRAANPEQARGGGGAPTGPTFGERMAQRTADMRLRGQMDDIDRAVRRGAISARSGLRAQQDLLETAQSGEINRAKLAQQAAEAASTEALARDKLAAETAMEREKLVSGEAIAGAKLGQAQSEAAQSAAEAQQKYAMDLAKFGFDVEKFGAEQAKTAFSQEVDRAQLGLREQEAGIKAAGQQTAASRAVAQSIRDVQEGFGDIRAVRSQASRLGQTQQVLAMDDEAQALIKRFQSGEAGYGQAQLAADLKRLGYDATETQ